MSDFRYGFRTLVRDPAFTVAAAVVLALGMGATTTIFALVHSVLLQPLPYPSADRLTWIWSVPPRSGVGRRALAGEDFYELRDRLRTFESITSLLPTAWVLSGAGEPERLLGALVTEDFLETLGVHPMIGRTFVPGDYRTGGGMTVMLSQSFWQRRFGADPSILGRQLIFGGKQYQVVGVTPPLYGFATNFDVWAPLTRDAPYAVGHQARLMQTFGRLKPGVTRQQAQTEIQQMAADFEQRHAQDHGYTLRLISVLDEEVGGVRQTIWIFAAAVGCVLLITCANVASLLLARGAARVREMAVRAAMGADRVRLVRQLLVESGMIALLGGALGWPLAVGGLRLLLALGQNAIPRSQEIRVDLRVLGFAFLLSLLTGLIFGIVPALRGSRVSLRDSLKEGDRGTGRRGMGLRSSLVVAEIAIGVMLMAVAGLLARSLNELHRVPAGYDVRNVLTLELTLPTFRYANAADTVRFFERVVNDVERIPGVQAAGGSNILPLAGARNSVGMWLDSQPVHSLETQTVTENRVVLPGYFSALRVPLEAGRFFDSNDRADTPKVVLVNDVFARQFFPAGDAVGHRMTLNVGSPWTGEIVGVVGSFRESSLVEEPRRELFTTLPQTIIQGETLVVRTAVSPAQLIPAIRGAIASIDRDVPVFNIRTMQEQVDRSLAQPRLRSALLGIFSLVALVLATLGVYGVIACSVVERKQEIGIRMALGARQGQVRAMIVRQGLKLTAIGLALGLAGAATVTRLLQSFLFGVRAGDPASFGGTVAVFVAVTLAATYIPVRRATAGDPLRALREE